VVEQAGRPIKRLPGIVTVGDRHPAQFLDKPRTKTIHFHPHSVSVIIKTHLACSNTQSTTSTLLPAIAGAIRTS
jgi:hypothetical protein